jgi:hypothetical protein
MLLQSDCTRGACRVQRSDWIQCDGCDGWFHPTCQGMPMTAYYRTMLNAESAKPPFVCAKCNEQTQPSRGLGKVRFRLYAYWAPHAECRQFLCSSTPGSWEVAGEMCRARTLPGTLWTAGIPSTSRTGIQSLRLAKTRLRGRRGRGARASSQRALEIGAYWYGPQSKTKVLGRRSSGRKTRMK